MYFLVDDVDRYHEFLPWCKNSLVLKREHSVVTARIEIFFKGLSTAFTTRNCLLSDQEITMDEKACRVSLDVQFSLAGRFASQTITPVFKHICNTLVESFAERAKELYGDRQFT